MITRTVRIEDIEEIRVYMDFAKDGIHERIGMNALKKTLMAQPLTAMIKRTPLANKTRYDYYNRKDGSVTRTGHSSGSVKALRNAVQNNPVRETDRPNCVTFGAHANATLDYAPYVHEALKPKEGEYWRRGMLGYGRGWTTQSTGNRFVTRAVEQYADWIPETVCNVMDRDLKRYGL